MNNPKPEISVRLIRPIDCSAQLIDAYKTLLLAHTSVKDSHFRQGLAGVEQFVIAVADNAKLVGTACLKYQSRKYQQYLFKQAGVPEMYNPDSIESAWVCVHPDFRGMGIWNKMHEIRSSYLGNRPYHATHRVENHPVSKRTERRDGYRQAGKDFNSVTSEYKLRLVVANHDLVYDPVKKLIYGTLPEKGN
ncbi:hypothetical protein [Sneathiella glossodoripedis]|uniref:hypothetical protein n=1 Tax=Sneathiella glossodoripedis TaxID=418853 RepID=UPI0004719DAA|nr:hypothetical protein [Sneathiella glossodoripedis]